jgi:hypothetical protein
MNVIGTNDWAVRQGPFTGAPQELNDWLNTTFSDDKLS